MSPLITIMYKPEFQKSQRAKRSYKNAAQDDWIWMEGHKPAPSESSRTNVYCPLLYTCTAGFTHKSILLESESKVNIKMKNK